jgi:hypothetical protein
MGSRNEKLSSQAALSRKSGRAVASAGKIERSIISIRGGRVMLDTDLASVYDVTTKALNQAVKRNADRFPPDFCFHLTAEERDELVTNCDRFQKLRHSTVMPQAFTEHGALMVASVLNSHRAVEVSVFVVRAFVRLREMALTHVRIARELEKLRDRVDVHDASINAIMQMLDQLLNPPARTSKRIGFQTGKEEKEP